MTKEDRFHSKDLYLSSAVALFSGLDPSCELDGKGKVIFVFPEDSGVRKSVMAFHDGSVAPISEYVEKVRALRSAMFAARGGR